VASNTVASKLENITPQSCSVSDRNEIPKTTQMIEGYLVEELNITQQDLFLRPAVDSAASS
jgi:hypothetical protein